MYVLKKILISSAVSLFAGVATTIGTKVGGAIWDTWATTKLVKQ
jgi:hypothetical protein